MNNGDTVYVYRIKGPTKIGSLSILPPTKAEYIAKPGAWVQYIKFLEGSQEGCTRYAHYYCICETIEKAISNFNRDIDLIMKAEEDKHNKIMGSLEKNKILM